MSFNICSITGNLVEEPVVSKLTGHIFEKNIIEKYILNFGKCPITQNPMKENDLIKINTENFTRPRNIKENSVGGLFCELQNGMQNLLGETYDLKKQVDNGREELSHSLYQYDASLRVITKLIKERDSIIQEINELKDEFEDIETEAYVNEESDFCGFYQGLINRIEELSMLLGKMRRERKTPGNYPNITKKGVKKYMRFTYDNMKEEKNNGNLNFLIFLFSSYFIIYFLGNSNKKFLSCFNLNNFSDNLSYYLCGYSDGNVQLKSFDANEIKENLENENENEENNTNSFKNILTLKNHKSEITVLEFFPSETEMNFVYCSKENMGSFMIGDIDKEKPNFLERYKITCHAKSISSCSFHPSKEYAGFGALDNYWSFHNMIKVKNSIKFFINNIINREFL